MRPVQEAGASRGLQTRSALNPAWRGGFNSQAGLHPDVSTPQDPRGARFPCGAASFICGGEARGSMLRCAPPGPLPNYQSPNYQ